MNRQLYLAQRITAMLLAPLVLVHLALIVIAVRNGLTAEEILSRTQGSFLWAAFYSLFVVAVSIHAPIGLRSILREWTSLNGSMVNGLCLFFAAILSLTGMRAVMAVI